jgi:hypothetical protein
MGNRLANPSHPSLATRGASKLAREKELRPSMMPMHSAHRRVTEASLAIGDLLRNALPAAITDSLALHFAPCQPHSHGGSVRDVQHAYSLY